MAGLAASFGSGAMTNSIDEFEGADVLLLTGSNTTENHPIISQCIKRGIRRGMKLIVVDPRKIDLVEMSTMWLKHKPGTDVAWINGMMHVIIQEGLWDRDYVEERTEGFEELRKAVESFTPQVVEQITGIPAKDLQEAARLYARAERASIAYAMGITQHITGTDNVKSLANLAMLCGNVGIISGGVNPLRGQNNVQGACDMGALPNVYPGYQRVNDEAICSKFEKAWEVSLSPIPGLTVTEIMEGARSGKVGALYIMGENPMLSDPDIGHVEEALRSLEFLVVQDLFLTETARLAHVVFPSASYAERDGTYTNTERRVQQAFSAIAPLGQSRPDWEIICSLARRLGHEWNYSSTAEIMDEIARLTPSYGGITHERLDGEGLQWPCPTRDHPGTPILHKERFTRGKGLFHPIQFIPADELPDEHYPFILTTGRVLYQFHTGTMTRKSRGIEALYPEGPVEINPEDALRLGIQEGDFVEVESRRGSIHARARVTRRSPEGVVFMTFHFHEAAANVLTNPAVDPVAKIPEYKVCAVRISKAA